MFAALQQQQPSVAAQILYCITSAVVQAGSSISEYRILSMLDYYMQQSKHGSYYAPSNVPATF